jgi:hypothetical protein
MGNYSIFEPYSWHLKLWHCIAPWKLVMKWSLYVHICQLLCDASIASDFNVPSSDVRWTWFVEYVVPRWGTMPQPPTLCELQWWSPPPNDKNCPMYLKERTNQELSHGGPSLCGYIEWFLENKPRMLNRSYRWFSIAFRGSRQVFKP